MLRSRALLAGHQASLEVEAMPFATLAFSRTVETRSGSSGKRSPSRAIRATRTLRKPGAGTWPGLGRLVK
jgi:hypothetical protein